MIELTDREIVILTEWLRLSAEGKRDYSETVRGMFHTLNVARLASTSGPDPDLSGR